MFFIINDNVQFGQSSVVSPTGGGGGVGAARGVVGSDKFFAAGGAGFEFGVGEAHCIVFVFAVVIVGFIVNDGSGNTAWKRNYYWIVARIIFCN